MAYVAHYHSKALGGITLTSDGHALTGLYLDGQRHFLASVEPPLEEAEGLPVLSLACDWLDRYLAGRRPASEELPLAPPGSEFRRLVWRILLGIPYGQVRTYGDIAEAIESETGRKTSARAVGGAVGHNPVSIVIPCHRVLGADGSLTGYAGGVGRKAWLLRHEGVRL